MEKIIKCLILALIIGVVTGCDSDKNDSNVIGGTTSDTSDNIPGGTTAPTITANPGAAHTIVISYPTITKAMNLNNGFYRRRAALIVTDQEGHAVADGTEVTLNVIDSVMVKGTIATTDSIAGTTLMNALPTLGDGITQTTFQDAYVIRNFAHRFIESNDHIMLINADEEDKDRLVAAVLPLANSIEATAAYVNSYPNDIYDGLDESSDITSYVIGASLLGVEISGRQKLVDEDGNVIMVTNEDGSKIAKINLTTGVSATDNGIAEFDITYPVNLRAILTGCFDSSATDLRAIPAGSAEVFVVAKVSGTNLTTVNNDFCFSSIAGEHFDAPSHTNISGTVNFSADLRDGGDEVYLPFVGVGSFVEITTNTGGLVVTAPGGATDSSGTFSTTITVSGGATGDSATVRFTSGSAVQEVTVTIP